MVILHRLDITGVRNLRNASLNNLSSINVLFGDNGAGKTSVLESIHLLSSARSFRSHKLKPLINSDMDSCVAFGEVAISGAGIQPVGVQRFRSKSCASVIKVSGRVVTSASKLAENLPLQTINADTFKLLDGAPVVRRQFLDWGVFHVEHRFHLAWLGFQRSLKQRNTLLRHGRMSDAQLPVWTKEFVRFSEQLDQFRSVYFKSLLPIFHQTLDRLLGLKGIELSYHRGWDKDKPLADVLFDQQQKEIEQGYTGAGPHRADLRFRHQSCNAADVLSRGQQKLVVCALRIAQGYLLTQLTGRSCVFLLDDLPAELDKSHRLALCELLEELKCQVFITCVDRQDIVDCWSKEASIKMFHVEHGNITDIND